MEICFISEGLVHDTVNQGGQRVLVQDCLAANIASKMKQRLSRTKELTMQ